MWRHVGYQVDTSVPEEHCASNFTVSCKILPPTTPFLPYGIPPKSFISAYHAWTILNMESIASHKTENQILITKEITANAPSPESLKTYFREVFFFSMAQQPLVGQGLLIVEASRPHSDTSHSVGLLWTSDRPDAQTSTWQLTTLTGNRQPFRRRDSKPQSQQASGRRPTP